MKKFNNFNSAFDWTKKIIEKGTQLATETIAEQVYKDSNDFTYRESGDMYKSGELHSNFKEGIIIERSPYVRRRYYEGGNPGKASPKLAQSKWFDKTVEIHKKKYQKMAVNAIKIAKKEV